MNPLVPVYRKYRADGLSAERAVFAARVWHIASARYGRFLSKSECEWMVEHLRRCTDHQFRVLRMTFGL